MSVVEKMAMSVGAYLSKFPGANKIFNAQLQHFLPSGEKHSA